MSNQQSMPANSGAVAQSKIENIPVSETESEAESVTTAEDLSWQEDPEFQAKVRSVCI